MTPSLLDLLSVDRIRSLLQEAETRSHTIAAARESLVRTMPNSALEQLLEEYEQVSRALSIARSWSDARFSLAQTDETAAALESETVASATAIAERTMFLTIVLKTWPTPRLERAGTDLPRYKQFFHELVLAKAHSLVRSVRFLSLKNSAPVR